LATLVAGSCQGKWDLNDVRVATLHGRFVFIQR
jgi:hypothetical protein